MKNVANFVLFNVCWFAAVEGAAQGWVWLGPLAFGAMVLHHLGWLVPPAERRRELRYLLLIGAVGTLLDTVMHRSGLIVYPTSTQAWPFAVVPPWIVSLWIGFATLPRLSLAWLGRCPIWLAVVFGAVGGPLSFWGGTHFGSIGPGGELWVTLGVLGVEYGVLMPLMLRLAPANVAVSFDGTPSSSGPNREEAEGGGTLADV